MNARANSTYGVPTVHNHAFMPARRFPPPWSVEEQPACFVLRDANGEVLAYVYCEEAAAKLRSEKDRGEATE
jgi:hypothetical protein